MLTRTLSVRMPFGTLPSQVLLPGGGVGEFLARHAVMDLGVNNVDDSLAAVTAGGEVVTLNMVELQVSSVFCSLGGVSECDCGRWMHPYGRRGLKGGRDVAPLEVSGCLDANCITPLLQTFVLAEQCGNRVQEMVQGLRGCVVLTSSSCRISRPLAFIKEGSNHKTCACGPLPP